MVKLLACGAKGPGFDSRSRRYDSRDRELIATQSLLFKRENEELPTDTSSSRFGPTTITVAGLAKQRFARIPKKIQEQWWCSG